MGTMVAVACVCAGAEGCAFLGGGEPAETPQQVVARETREQDMLREVLARLAAEPSIGADRIRPEVVGREIHLHGAVRGFGALQCARANAELVPGVTLVVDFLVLEPGPSRVTCLAPRVFGTAGTAGPST